MRRGLRSRRRRRRRPPRGSALSGWSWKSVTWRPLAQLPPGARKRWRSGSRPLRNEQPGQRPLCRWDPRCTIPGAPPLPPGIPSRDPLMCPQEAFGSECSAGDGGPGDRGPAWSGARARTRSTSTCSWFESLEFFLSLFSWYKNDKSCSCRVCHFFWFLCVVSW